MRMNKIRIVYFISVELPEQGSITKKGDITLVR